MREKLARGVIPLLVLAVLVPAVAGIAGADEVRDRIDSFKKAMKSGEERDRIGAVNELAALSHKSVNKELRRVVTSDRSERVRAAAALALGRLGNPKDIGFLTGSIRALKKKPIALAGVVDAIGDFRDPRTAEPLYDVARSWLTKHKYPAMAAIRSLGDVPSLDSIEYLIKIYELTFPKGAPGHDDGTTYYPPADVSDETQARLSDYRPYVVKSLQKLTGEQFADLDIWKEWWDDNGRTFDPTQTVDDPNSQLKLVDDEFRYEIARPGDGWKWVGEPEKGFDRTASLTEGGKVTARVSVLAYSVWTRSPATAAEMAEKEKEFLRQEFAFVTEEKWDEKVTVGKTEEHPGVEAIRQTIQGTWGTSKARVVQTIFVHRGILYVVRLTTLPGLSYEGARDATDFVDSFEFLL